jgi:type II secretory pathway component PulC
VAALIFGASAVAADEMPMDRSSTAFRMPPLETFAEVTARPLFSPDRRPRDPAPIEAGPIAPVALKGIVISGKNHYAVVEEGTPAAPKRVTEGQTLDAGTIKRIGRDHIVLSMRGGADTIIKLFETTKQNDGRARETAPQGAAQFRPPEIPAEFARSPAARQPLTVGPSAR